MFFVDVLRSPQLTAYPIGLFWRPSQQGCTSLRKDTLTADRCFCASQTAEPSVVGLLREAKRQHTEHYEARKREEEARVALSGQGGSGEASVDESPAARTATPPEAAEASQKDGGGKEEKDEDGDKGLSESLLLRVCMGAWGGTEGSGWIGRAESRQRGRPGALLVGPDAG